MALTSWTEDIPPGRYHFEITESKETTSQKGDLMWKIRLNTTTGFDSIEDVIMLTGAGAKMGNAKLQRLGVTKEMLPLDCGAIVGRKLYANVAHKPDKLDPSKIRVGVDGMYEADPDQPAMNSAPF